MIDSGKDISREKHFGILISRRPAILVAVTASLILSGSCSGKGGEKKGESAHPDTPAVVTPEQDVTPSDIILTPDGIGPVRIGMSTDSIPERCPGIYDSVVAEEGYESNSYLFLEEGRAVFTAYEFTPGRIDVIGAESPRVVVAAPEDVFLRLGGEFRGVLGLPGVKADWEHVDSDGMWCWSWRGIWFQPDQSHLPEGLGNKLYNDKEIPEADLFTSDVRIGYIGTGLPW